MSWPDIPTAQRAPPFPPARRRISRWPASPPAASSRSTATARSAAVPRSAASLPASTCLQIDTPNGTPLARISVHLRNQLIYALTGGGQATNPAYRLDIRMVATQQQIIVDINSGRPEVLNYGINASYTMTDLATGRVVVNSTTSSRVSYNIPGQEQRFAGARGLRDAENRAADVIARNINARLASYFVAGTFKVSHTAEVAVDHDRHQSRRRRPLHRPARSGAADRAGLWARRRSGARARRRAGACLGRRSSAIRSRSPASSRKTFPPIRRGWSRKPTPCRCSAAAARSGSRPVRATSRPRSKP